MAIRQSFIFLSGRNVGFVVKRADGQFYDPASQAFAATHPATLIAAPENPAPETALYSLMLADTPEATFPDGGYTLVVHDADDFAAKHASVEGVMPIAMTGGDDSPTLPVQTVLRIDTSKIAPGAVAALAPFGFSVVSENAGIVEILGRVVAKPTGSPPTTA